MFRANEALIGKEVEYNGSPHEFSSSSVDPHRFRVVGGTFLNSGQTNHAGCDTQKIYLFLWAINLHQVTCKFCVKN